MTSNNVVVLLKKAEEDVAQAYAWYEKQERGLGEEFLRCVDAAIQLIGRNPEMYSKVHKDFRKCVVRRFPYMIFYEYSPNTVTIFAIFHCSQHPQKWRGLLA
ncbi:MAG: recombinase [Pseudanabaena sp.]|nr:MAG: recombinase [Pseudanabaena sp.]